MNRRTKENTAETKNTDKPVKLIEISTSVKKVLKTAGQSLEKLQIARANKARFEDSADSSYKKSADEQYKKHLEDLEKLKFQLIALVKANAMKEIYQDEKVNQISEQILKSSISHEIKVEKKDLEAFNGRLSKRTLRKIKKFLSESAKYSK